MQTPGKIYDVRTSVAKDACFSPGYTEYCTHFVYDYGVGAVVCTEGGILDPFAKRALRTSASNPGTPGTSVSSSSIRIVC